MQVRGLVKEFEVKGHRGAGVVKAVTDVDLDIMPGEAVGLVAGHEVGQGTRRGFGPAGLVGEELHGAGKILEGSDQRVEHVEALVAQRQGGQPPGERRHLVFGSGNPKARLVFVGEGPGKDAVDDEPEIRETERLHVRMIEAARHNVFIENQYLTDLYKKALGTVDKEERDAILRELVEILLDDVAFIPIGNMGQMVMWWPWVQNYYGELACGVWALGRYVAPIWLDQDMKAKMGK